MELQVLFHSHRQEADLHFIVVVSPWGASQTSTITQAGCIEPWCAFHGIDNFKTQFVDSFLAVISIKIMI